jgi:UDP-glucose 4-epimerase
MNKAAQIIVNARIPIEGRCLVTGAAGFIGSHLCETLLAADCAVVGVDSFTDYYTRKQKVRNLQCFSGHPRFALYEADLATLDLASILESVDYVFHTAGQPGVRASWGTQFEDYIHANVRVTQRLLEAARQTPVRKLILSSSSSVYGQAVTMPVTEESPTQPRSPYGVTKLAGEHLWMLYHANFDVPTVALRYFTVYGPRQRPDMATHRFIREALEEQPLVVFGDGRQSRDFTYIDDVVAANIAAATSAVVGVPINVAGGSRTTVNALLALIKEETGTASQIVYRQAQDGDVLHTYADTTRAATLLGWKPIIDLADGVRREVAWLREVIQRGA